MKLIYQTAVFHRDEKNRDCKKVMISLYSVRGGFKITGCKHLGLASFALMPRFAGDYHHFDPGGYGRIYHA